MSDEQTYLSIQSEELLPKVRELREQGWRLVQISATPLGEMIEVNYSFDRAGKFLNLRLELPAAAARIPSVSSIYWCAFIYENEMHDLFRVQVEGIVVDYKGNFYKTTVPYPFSRRGQPSEASPSDPAVAASPSATSAPVSAPATTSASNSNPSA